MHREPIARPALRLPRWQRRTLHGTALALLASGIVWLVVHYGWGAGRGELPPPLELWCLRAHGLAGFVALFVFGALAAAHVPQGWRLSTRRGWGRQRASGLALMAGSIALAASGYALYYFVSESARPWVGAIHAAVGIGLAPLVWWHRRGGARATARAVAHDARAPEI